MSISRGFRCLSNCIIVEFSLASAKVSPSIFVDQY
jgi:hypothetical protein